MDALTHIDNGFYQVSDELAAAIARANPCKDTGSEKLPPEGWMREVEFKDQWWWLSRTPYQYRIDSPARGWVWALHASRRNYSDAARS